MNRIKKNILRTILILFLLTGVGLAVIFALTSSAKTQDSWKEFSALLMENETVIDGVTDHNITYLITSREGRQDYGDTLTIFEKHSDIGWRRIYDNDFSGLKPWKIELSDIDGEGEKEIITAVRKTTRFDKTLKNRLFAFNLKNNKLVKKWTGSEVGGDWKDFIAADLIPIKGNELIFISKTKRGERISIYYWFNFGFIMLAQSKDYEKITNITINGENQIGITYKKDNKEHKVILRAKDGILE